MKKLLITAVGAMLVGSLSMAADAENAEKATTDVSKNPITGTKTTTKKYKQKAKSPNGAGQEVEVTEKTKEHTDGTVKRDVEVDAEAVKK